MNKVEADSIIDACKKYRIAGNIRKEIEEYYINFYQLIEVKDYQSAKLITNALIIEKRTNSKFSEKYEDKDAEIPTSIKSRYHNKKKINPEKNWGEKRS